MEPVACGGARSSSPRKKSDRFCKKDCSYKSQIQQERDAYAPTLSGSGREPGPKERRAQEESWERVEHLTLVETGERWIERTAVLPCYSSRRARRARPEGFKEHPQPQGSPLVRPPLDEGVGLVPGPRGESFSTSM